MGVKLRIEWLDVQRETAIGKLLESECDLAFGAAIDPDAIEDEEELAGKVIYSRPYYGTGYLLVARKDGPQVKAAGRAQGGKIARGWAAEAGSVADYHLRQRGYQRSLYRNQLAVLKAIDSGGIDYAYLWANVGWTLDRHARIQAWRSCRTTCRRTTGTSRSPCAKAMTELQAAGRCGLGEAGRQTAPWPGPWRNTTCRISRRLSSRNLTTSGNRLLAAGQMRIETMTTDQGQPTTLHHPVANRGLEPQMQKVQYVQESLQRPGTRFARRERLSSASIRTTCRFRRRIPEPAGLDYEIAGLLGGEIGRFVANLLGLSRRTTLIPRSWPRKKLCDVILGVMPDDRFAERVLYSQPVLPGRLSSGGPASGPSVDRLDESARARWRLNRESRCGDYLGVPREPIPAWKPFSLPWQQRKLQRDT